MMNGFPDSHYVIPTMVIPGGRSDTGRATPETREELPPALYSPGASTEEGLLSEIADHRAFLRWPGQQVGVPSNARIEIDGTVHEVVGHPNIWPLGTTVTLYRVR